MINYKWDLNDLYPNFIISICYYFFINKKIQRMKSQQVVISQQIFEVKTFTNWLAEMKVAELALAVGCVLGDLQPLENSWENSRWYTVMAIEVAIKWL